MYFGKIKNGLQAYQTPSPVVISLEQDQFSDDSYSNSSDENYLHRMKLFGKTESVLNQFERK